MDTGQEQVIRELISVLGEVFDLISSMNSELELYTTSMPHHIRDERRKKIQKMKECLARVVQFWDRV